ncbi:hypothetical protein ACFFGT_08360, partial [Mucilaginibacter angelicae]
MDTVKNLILELQALDVNISVEGDTLAIDSRKGLIDDRLKNLIRSNKLELIKYINQIRDETYTKISKVRESESYVMSSAQRRLWVLCQLEEGNAAYNMSGVHVFEGVLEVGCLSS